MAAGPPLQLLEGLGPDSRAADPTPGAETPSSAGTSPRRPTAPTPGDKGNAANPNTGELTSSERSLLISWAWSRRFAFKFSTCQHRPGQPGGGFCHFLAAVSAAPTLPAPSPLPPCSLGSVLAPRLRHGAELCPGHTAPTAGCQNTQLSCTTSLGRVSPPNILHHTFYAPSFSALL